MTMNFLHWINQKLNVIKISTSEGENNIDEKAEVSDGVSNQPSKILIILSKS